MLKFAFPYKEKLNQIYCQAITQERNKYYLASTCFYYTITINPNSWEMLQMVSVDKDDNIIGYFSATICRENMSVTGVEAINFIGELNITFSKDFYAFLNELFVKYKFFKVSWYVVVGNPAEKMYDKIIKKYNGRIVGTKKQDILLYTGERCDLKMYEVFQTDYLKSIRK